MNTTTTETKARSLRHPVVVVLGHIDHGKTTLLDTIRKTNVVAKEAGGITQHLGAYEIVWNGKKITFIDTPGHETFAKMRERGARVADVGILVVAADDGVKPQTKEAYEAIKQAEIPFIVALNKIDKSTADPDRVKAQLAEMGVLVEGWGGSVPIVPVSAKEGKNIDELLDTVLLAAELEELSADQSASASGVVIEAHLDSRRGPSAMLLVTDGALRKGEFVVAGDASAPVRILEGSDGKPVDQALPSSPVTVVGFSKVPAVGAQFRSYASKKEMEAALAAAAGGVARKEEDAAEIGILIKADTAGSHEALSDELRKIVPKEIAVKFFEGGVGDVTDADIKLVSSAKKAIVIGFNAKIKNTASDLAERFGVSVRTFSVVYEAIDWVSGELKALVPKELLREELGKLLVLKTFRSSSAGRVVGGRMREGKVRRDAHFEIIRQGTRVGEGTVASVERNKVPVEELKEGEEGGLLVHSSKAIEERDILSFFYEREA